MCGIALIVAGIKLITGDDFTSSRSPLQHHQDEAQPSFTEDDIKCALGRRGPDSLGTKTLILRPASASNSIITIENDYSESNSFTTVVKFIGATLQLRGLTPILQPLVDSSNNILIYNGEIFGGVEVGRDSNDGEVLMERLSEYNADGKECIVGVLSRIKGPWALIYWQDSLKTLWFGRDAFGRRSLLVHWPTKEDSRFLLSSVSPLSSVNGSAGFEDESVMGQPNFWEELSCGVYSMTLGTQETGDCIFGELKKHKWADPELEELVMWERRFVEPKPQELCATREKVACRQQYLHSADSVTVQSNLGCEQLKHILPAQKVLVSLRESVMRRTASNTIYQAVPIDYSQGFAPVAVLFSGGLDSMILAALLHQCIDTTYQIDLLNVSFDGLSAPDRISARAGLRELQKVAPLRRWKLIEIDAHLPELLSETKHVVSLISPANTYMDLNIGLALWLAARGDGWLYEDNNTGELVRCRSESRILLVGAGADEQCAGYGRHRTKYRQGSWLGLHNEMKLDMQRIWKRNLGRDDRCIADNGKEARFPFLDEDVIRTLLDVPLWEIADLDQSSGTGDKKILREVAQLLGLSEAAMLPKRAIQFGSRIARESNRKNFGSNRAANQASAGSAVIFGPSN